MELVKQISASRTRASLEHMRTATGAEVDFVLRAAVAGVTHAHARQAGADERQLPLIAGAAEAIRGALAPGPRVDAALSEHDPERQSGVLRRRLYSAARSRLLGF
jgi:hypothetical protein